MASTNKTPTTNICNSEILKAFPLKSQRREGCSLSRFLFSIVVEVPVSPVRHGKDRKDQRIGKKETTKIPLFTNDLTVNKENSKGSTEKLLE